MHRAGHRSRWVCSDPRRRRWRCRQLRDLRQPRPARRCRSGPCRAVPDADRSGVDPACHGGGGGVRQFCRCRRQRVEGRPHLRRQHQPRCHTDRTPGRPARCVGRDVVPIHPLCNRGPVRRRVLRPEDGRLADVHAVGLGDGWRLHPDQCRRAGRCRPGVGVHGPSRQCRPRRRPLDHHRYRPLAGPRRDGHGAAGLRRPRRPRRVRHRCRRVVHALERLRSRRPVGNRGRRRRPACRAATRVAAE